MFDISMFRRGLATVAVAACAAGAADAAVVTWDAIPATPAPMVAATSTTGTVYEGVTGSVAGLRRSPYLESPTDVGIQENDPAAVYTAVTADSSATYDFGGVRNTLSFVWGSPDDYNIVEFLLGGVVVDTFTVAGLSLADIFPARFGTSGAVATFSGVGATGLFDSVRLSSNGSNAFEYAGIAAVPVPAAGLLLLTALGGAAALRRRKKAA